MQTLKRLYRSNYAGEHVISTLSLNSNEWNPETEYVDNSVFNTHTTSQAVAIGNGESRKGFDLGHITRHSGGLLAADKLQSYGCNALYRDFHPDFLVLSGKEITREVATSRYVEDHIVYGNADVLLEYPNRLYLLPQNLYYDAGALAVYLACFDGHTKIFMIGYDGYPTNGPVNNIYKDTNGYLSSSDTQNGTWFTKSLEMVMSVYNDVEFIRVMPHVTHYIPEEWQRCPNFRQIDYRGFAIEADLG